MSFGAAERIADTVLYEGYLLYPYRASAAKNQVRWQFGVVAPREAVEKDGSDPWLMQTECLIDVPPGGSPTIDLRIRHLHLQARHVEEKVGEGADFVPVDALEVDGQRILSWDEATERSVDAIGLSLADLQREPLVVALDAPDGIEVEELREEDGSLRGRIVRTRWAIVAAAHVSAEEVDHLVRLRVRIENTTPWSPDASTGRDVIMRRSLLGAHTLIRVDGGDLVSLTDPPAAARDSAASCQNLHTWPVLVGAEASHDLLLSSPIILPDHPEIAPESPNDLFDATEIDEILTLRILTLTEEEKREARATDPRARRILERSEEIPPEVFERLHGAIRSISNGPSASPPSKEPTSWADDPSAPFWEPEARVPPDQATVEIRGRLVSKGARVLLHPAPRRDTMDMFLAEKVGIVSGVFESVDDETFVALTMEDDPASDLHEWYGRYLYFRPEELEPLGDVVVTDT